MPRGRPRLSDEEKASRKAAKEAGKYDPRDAIVAMWSEPEKLHEELVQIPTRLISEAAEARAEVGAHKKRVLQQTRMDPIVYATVQRLEKLTGPRRSRAIRQLMFLIEKMSLDDQPELPLYEPGTVTADDGKSIFDATPSGEKQAAERGDDPGRARKSTKSNPPVPPADTGALSPEEALNGFEAANAAKAGGFEEGRPSGDGEDDNVDLRARFMQPQPDPEPPVKGKKPKKGLGDGAEASGSYSLQ